MILDHLENLTLSSPEFEEHFEARMALARLAEGLSWVFEEVTKIQNVARGLANKERDKDGNISRIVVAGGLLDKVPIGVLSNAFNWYAISACSYAQLVGWLKYRDTKSAKDYVQRVMPRLSLYRNKVAAHLAITAPYSNDNEADLIASLLTGIVFLQGYFFAAAIEPIIERENEKISVSNKMSWSLTIAHERLLKRWWPNGHEKSYTSMKLGPGETKKFVSDWSYINEDVV